MAYTNKPQSLDLLLKEYMKRMGRRSEMKRGMVLHFWGDVVGSQVSKATRELRFENDKLVVTVENEAWRHELHMSRFSIKKKLNGKVGSETVKEIMVRC